jgi:hypothetical protein
MATRIVTIAGKNSDYVPVGMLAAIRRATGLRIYVEGLPQHLRAG